MGNVVEKIAAFCLAVVMAAAVSGNLGKLQLWVWQHEAKLLYESRTTTWGSPRFFHEGSRGSARQTQHTR